MSDIITNEYNNFMKWFKENHPEMYEKYGRNIDVPFQEGGGVAVNNSWKISEEEHEAISKIARTYYHPNEK